MKRLAHLWPQVVTFENLYRAYRRARLGKAKRDDVAGFTLELEANLVRLQQELISGDYHPGRYRQFTLYERKPRLISVAPFRDRVVHHAVMAIVEPLIDRQFIDDSYACRRGRGVHKAADRYQKFAKRYSYVMKLDIQRYFPSIDHHCLKEELRRRIKDKPVLQLLEQIIDNGLGLNGQADPVYFPGDDLFTPSMRSKGLPIGNLTSQFFANLYLDRFDHWLKETLKVPAYLRYVDDFILLADSKAQLWAYRDAIEHRLQALRLRVHPNKVGLFRSSQKIDFLGYQLTAQRRWLRNDNGHRFGRRMAKMSRAYARGELSLGQISPRVNSWIGHALHGETLGLRRILFRAYIFRREQVE